MRKRKAKFQITKDGKQPPDDNSQYEDSLDAVLTAPISTEDEIRRRKVVRKSTASSNLVQQEPPGKFKLVGSLTTIDNTLSDTTPQIKSQQIQKSTSTSSSIHKTNSKKQKSQISQPKNNVLNALDEVDVDNPFAQFKTLKKKLKTFEELVTSQENESNQQITNQSQAKSPNISVKKEQHTSISKISQISKSLNKEHKESEKASLEKEKKAFDDETEKRISVAKEKGDWDKYAN